VAVVHIMVAAEQVTVEVAVAVVTTLQVVLAVKV
jgi:hypothetical protein